MEELDRALRLKELETLDGVPARGTSNTGSVVWWPGLWVLNGLGCFEASLITKIAAPSSRDGAGLEARVERRWSSLGDEADSGPRGVRVEEEARQPEFHGEVPALHLRHLAVMLTCTWARIDTIRRDPYPRRDRPRPRCVDIDCE